MLDKRCDWCGKPNNLARADARFCSTKCRVYAGRKAKRDAKNVEFPPVLRARQRWVRYASSKVPLTVEGAPASSTNPATWDSFEHASASSIGAGVGFVLGNGVGCIDLDHCLVDGSVEPWARDVLDANPNTYVEVSMSGTGLHVFGWLAEAPGRKFRDGRNVEVYSRGRYIAATGRRFSDAPLSFEHLIV